MDPYNKWRDDVALQEYINSTNMEHTYIEQQLEANFLDGDKINDCGKTTFTVSGALDIAKYFYKLGRTETLMECKKIVGEPKYNENAEDMNSGAYEYHAINGEKLRIRTAIDTLIKKETI